jgi:hypothetical protein
VDDFTGLRKKYYYLVESYRDGRKPRQRTLAYLGPKDTVKDALEYWEERLAESIKWHKTCLDIAEKEKGLLRPWHFQNGEVKPNDGRRNIMSKNHLAEYWEWHEYAKKYDNRIQEIQERIDKIKSFQKGS